MSSKANIEQRPVFAVAPADETGVVTLIVGIPRAAWVYMKDGRTTHFELTRVGLPLRVVLFGNRDHAAVMADLNASMAAQDLAYDDRRRDDWSAEEISHPVKRLRAALAAVRTYADRFDRGDASDDQKQALAAIVEIAEEALEETKETEDVEDADREAE